MPISNASSLFIALERAMSIVVAREYERIVRSGLWWKLVGSVLPSTGKYEQIAVVLDDAQLFPSGAGRRFYDDLATRIVEYENRIVGSGLRLSRSQIEDVDALGFQIAAAWSRGTAARAAYWPQKLVAACMLANPVGYDGKTLFALDHPVHPFDPTRGTFRNVFTGAASGDYPGAVPLTGSVETARAGLAKALAYISTIPLPTGAGPRSLKVAAMLVPPALLSAASEVAGACDASRIVGTSAGLQYMARPNAEGLDERAERAGLTAHSETMKRAGMPIPIEAPELAAKYGGSDTSFYLVVEEAGRDDMGAVTFVEREPFTIRFHGEEGDVQLSRTNEIEWEVQGRNTVGPGHPYLLFRCDAT